MGARGVRWTSLWVDARAPTASLPPRYRFPLCARPLPSERIQHIRTETRTHAAEDLAEELPGRRARRDSRGAVPVAGGADELGVQEIPAAAGVQDDGPADHVRPAGRKFPRAGRLFAKPGAGEGRPRRLDDAQCDAVSGGCRRRAAGRLCGRQRQPAVHAA